VEGLKEVTGEVERLVEERLDLSDPEKIFEAR
jgi:hypothetical protein